MNPTSVLPSPVPPPCIPTRCCGTPRDLVQTQCRDYPVCILLPSLSTYLTYLIFFLPNRSLTVSLQASFQYIPDSRSFSLAVRSFSILRSIVLNCLIVRARSTCFSNLFSTESITGQVMSGTLGAFFRILDQ